MSLSDVKKLLEKTGLPVVYNAWEEGTAPPLPFLCYSQTGATNFSADGKVYFSAKSVRIELYTKTKDENTEELVESALKDFFFLKEETYIDSEKCYEIIYEIEV